MTTESMDSARPTPSPRAACALPTRFRRARAALLCAVALAWGCDRGPSIEDVRAMQASGQFEATLEPLRARLSEMPDDPETNLLYGRALSRSGAPRVAIWTLRKAAESPDWEVAANLELADAQARAQNWAASIEASNAVLDAEPENVTALMLRGNARMTSGKEFERALEDFDVILESDPTYFPALASRASALLLMGKVDEAAKQIEAIEELVKQDPQDVGTQAQLCATRAVLQQERGDAADAEKRFDACLEKFPSLAIVIEPAMTFFDGKGDLERSRAILEKALSLVPMSIDYREALADRFEAAGDDDRALAVLKEGLGVEDREIRSALLTDIADYYVARDRLPEAIAAYEELLSMFEERPQLAILNHADLLARAGRHEEARRVAEGLENEAYAGLIEARIALDEGDPERALELLDAVFPTWPNNAGARYYAARAAEQLGDFVRAIDEYRQSIRSGADQTEASLRLAKLYLAAGSYAEAWNSASQYLMNHNDDPEGGRVLLASAGRDPRAPLRGLFSQIEGTPLWAAGAATRAETVAETSGPDAALKWIDEIAGPIAKWERPENAELIRIRLRLIQKAGRADEAAAEAARLVKSHPESAALLEIQAILLEERGAEPGVVADAFEKAVEKDEKDWLALSGLARARAAAGDHDAAIALYDRATKAHPESPAAAAAAAKLAAQRGDAADAEKRWAALLVEHPWNAEAAQALTEIRLARKQSDARTVDLAERAVMFGGGPPAYALLVRVHEARGETERAQAIARAMEEGKPIPPRNPPPTGDAAAAHGAPPAAPDPS